MSEKEYAEDSEVIGSESCYAEDNEVIGVRLYPDPDERDQNAWAVDGFDRNGKYSESVTRWQDFETALSEIDKYIHEFFPHLKGEVDG